MRDLLRVFRWIRPYLRHELLLFGLLLLGAAGGLAAPFVIGWIVDHVFVSGNFDRLPLLAVVLLGVSVLTSGLNLGASYLQTWITARVLVDMRLELFGHLQDLGPSYFVHTKLGDVMTRMGSDLSEVQGVASGALLQAAMSLLTLVAVAGGLLWLNPWLFLAGVVFVPALAGLLFWFRPKIRTLSMAVRDRNASIASHMLDSLQALRFIKASAAEGYERDIFRQRNEDLVDVVLRFRLWQGFSGGASGLITSANMVVVLLLGSAFLQRPPSDPLSLTAGELITFFMLQQRVYGPINSFAGLYLTLQRARASILRVFEILDAVPQITRPQDPVIPTECTGAVALEDVAFSYRPGQPVLDGLSLEIPAGTSLAVVGPSGVGKSTLIDLLLRLQDPDRGRVLIDGVDLRQLSPDWYLQQVALVGQRATMFQTSLAANLSYNAPDVTREQMTSTCEQLGLGPLLKSLPDGLDTPIGAGGAALSEGQKQRVGIARALLRQPRVLLVDEGTSALDWMSDEKTVAALTSLSGRSTSVFVTHRLGLAAKTDAIAVLHHGRLVQYGHHDELLAQTEGLYAALWARQADRRGRARP